MKSPRYGFFLACVCSVILLVFLFSVMKNTATTRHQQLWPLRQLPTCLCCDSRLFNATITPLQDNRTFIIAPYYDGRDVNNKVVRVLSILHHTEVTELYCLFCCQGQFVEPSKAQIDMHSDRFGFPYVTTDILCAEPENCNASYLAVHPSSSGSITQLPLFKIRNKNEQLVTKFTVCISTMFGNYSNVLQFIQTLEMYRILGAQRVVIYLNSCSQQMKKVIECYVTQGFLDIIPWPIERYLRPGLAWHYSIDAKDIGYYGQLATLNDCIYQNMYKSRFILLNDIDEIILPFKHQTWDSLMEDLQRQNPGAGIFLFENHIFPQTVSTDRNFSGTSLWKDVPGLNILRYVHREPDRLFYFNARKMIIDPTKVIQTSVHSVLKSFGKSVKVPLDTALVYHCRGPLQKKLPAKSLIEDKTIWKFNASLIKNVNQVLSELMENGMEWKS
ncbi:uncharacterized protein [Hyperolius riggenbachi]|uniref:uncharacterized protein n=1 Tax=Hyperolius riggenbachi TaxID=752182 RepID=UPI0035A350F3